MVEARDILKEVHGKDTDYLRLRALPFTDEVEARLDDAVIVRAIHQAIRELPEPQQAVVTLRDVEGLSTYEVAALLGLTEANVRVILHRGRAKVRAALEDTVKAGAP